MQMKRTAQLDDDTDQPPRQQQRTEAAFVLIGTEEVPLGETELNLRGKELTALPESIGKLQALTELNVSNNKLTKLPAAIGSLVRLTMLNVSKNKLTELPAAIGRLAALTKLDVRFNKLTELPAAISSLAALTTLIVMNNKLTELPAAISSLAALTTLDVGNNPLQLPPRAIAERGLPAIRAYFDDLRAGNTVLIGTEEWPLGTTELNLSSKGLTALPESIGKLQALTTLNVYMNQLTELPAAIGSLAALTELYVSRNQLTELPAAIGSLAALTTLEVNGNKLTELPAAIGSLTALTKLSVGDNQLTELPAAIGSLAALTTLKWGNNKLTKLPATIGSLAALTTLEVNGNKLTELPAAIGSLAALTKLSVGDNQLTELPAAIGSLAALTELYVSRNQLTELPAAIGSLAALTKLSVGDNQLTELPAAIGSLAALTELKVIGNPLQLPPYAVAQRGLSAIRAYFEDLRAGTAVARTCMLVLLGDAEMGKTSLLNGLLNDCAPDPAPAGADGRTIHMAIKPLPLGAGDSEVEFRCYDLGGQYKSYAAAQQAYVSRGALYLLVVSAEAATSAAHEERLRWWLHFLQTNAPGAVVQPVLTHADKCTSEAQAAERAAWVVGVCQRHLDRVNALPAGSPAPLSIQLDHVPRVNAATGEGAATLSAVRNRLLALACPPAGQPKLLPIVGQTIPKLWEPAIAWVHAVRSGADCTVAASTALLGTRPPSPVGVDGGGRPLLYELVARLKEKWEEVAAELVRLDAMGEGEEEAIERRKAAFSSPSHRLSILASALQLMADQGEIFISGDIAYLDPAAITDLIKPLVDHRLSDLNTYLSVGGTGKDLLTYLCESTPIANAQPKYEAMRAALQELASPRAQLNPDLLSFLWRGQEHQDKHQDMLCKAGLLLDLRLTNLAPHEYVMPLRLETTAPPGLDAAWPATPRKDESHFRRVYKWNSAGFVPPGLCEKMIAAFQGVAGCRYLRDASDGALVWQRGALLELGGATVKLEVEVVKEGNDLLLQLVADARGTDAGSVRVLLETGDVHTTLDSVLAGFPGLWMPLEAVVTRMEDKRMRSAVAVTVGNRHGGTAKAVDCHLSAQQLNAALEGRGLRVEAPWIDQAGGEPMLQRLRQVLASEVRPADDGFVFCFCGHGGAINLVGNDNAPTSYQAIIDAIAIEPNLRDKPKLIVFDCCRGNLASELGQLRLPKDMILARSTALSTQAFEQQSVGNVYSNRLAAAISSHAAAHSVVDLLKLTQGKVHGLRTPTPQVAHVELTLGAYHLFLGGLLC